MSAFSKGDLVSQPALDPASTGKYQHWLRQEVQIEIRSVEGRITARVTALGDFFSTLRPGMEHGFVLGEMLTLVPAGVAEDSWRIDSPRDRPWHVLSCRDGKKTFEHYR